MDRVSRVIQDIEEEVSEWLETHQQLAADGRRQVVRNGFMPQRKIVTGLGEIAVKQPRVYDRRPAPGPQSIRGA